MVRVGMPTKDEKLVERSISEQARHDVEATIQVEEPEVRQEV